MNKNFLLVFLLCGCFLVSFLPVGFGQVFWLDGWDYRCGFDVVGGVDGFQGNITLSFPEVFLDSVRVTESDGVTLIPIWNQSEIVVWCKFPVANSTYYLYWGNDEAVAVWDIDAVFEDVIGGVVLALSMDEGSGFYTYDVSGFGNEGSIWNDGFGNRRSDGWVDGFYRGGILMDGFDDAITFDWDDNLLIDGDGVTVMSWVYLPELPNDYSGVIDGCFPNLFYLLYLNGDNKVSFYTHTDIGGIVFNDNVLNEAVCSVGWNHVVGVYNGSYVNSFLNGSSSGYPVVQSGNLYHSGDLALVLGMYPSNPLECTLDETFIFDVGLNDSQIYNLYVFYGDSQILEGSVCCRVWVDDVSYVFGDVVDSSDVEMGSLLFGGLLIGLGFMFFLFVLVWRKR